MKASLAVAVLGASFAVSGCATLGVLAFIPLPESGPESLTVDQGSEARVIGDIRGVALRPEAGGQLIEFSEVSNVRWTESALVITTTDYARGDTDSERLTTASYPVADIESVIVRDYRKVRSSLASLGLGFALMTLPAALGLWPRE